MLTFTLLSDGISDSNILQLLEWSIAQSVNPYRLQFAWPLPPHSAGLRVRVQHALNTFPCNVLLVHRDAERGPWEDRVQEIDAAVAGLHINHVSVIPVRMSEAWLLLEEDAIRAATGNPRGTMPLNLPTIRNIESNPDPKKVLEEALKTASGLNTRRVRRFDYRVAKSRVAINMKNIGELLQLPAFSRYNDDVTNAIHVATRD